MKYALCVNRHADGKKDHWLAITIGKKYDIKNVSEDEVEIVNDWGIRMYYSRKNFHLYPQIEVGRNPEQVTQDGE